MVVIAHKGTNKQYKQRDKKKKKLVKMKNYANRGCVTRCQKRICGEVKAAAGGTLCKKKKNQSAGPRGCDMLALQKFVHCTKWLTNLLQRNQDIALPEE